MTFQEKLNIFESFIHERSISPEVSELYYKIVNNTKQLDLFREKIAKFKNSIIGSWSDKADPAKKVADMEKKYMDYQNIINKLKDRLNKIQ